MANKSWSLNLTELFLLSFVNSETQLNKTLHAYDEHISRSQAKRFLEIHLDVREI